MKDIGHILSCLELDDVSVAEAHRIEAIVTAVAAAPEGAGVDIHKVDVVDPDGDHSTGYEVLLDHDPDGDYCRPVTVLGIIPDAAVRDYVPGHKVAAYLSSLLGDGPEWWK